MKILLISYGDYDYDGRLRELCKVFSNLGELYVITRGATPSCNNHILFNCNYLHFIKSAIEYGKSLKDIDIIVLDNRKAIIPGVILKTFLKPQLVIQDCRELYISRDIKHFAGKMGCVIEKIGIKQSDIIICANKFRANVMKQLYRLDRTPIVYENLRELCYSAPSAVQQKQEKFSQYIFDDEKRIISSSGCSVSRTNDILVSNIDKISHKCRLFLVGNNSESDREAIEKIIAQKKLNNVHILGQLDQDELKYLISVSHIGIVNYHQKDMNNKYCASGKVYEFIYEGVPVVTTTNPPLKQICDDFHIGEADDSYFNAINTVLDNYNIYRENAINFSKKYSVQENNEKLIQELTSLISSFNGANYGKERL